MIYMRNLAVMMLVVFHKKASLECSFETEDKPLVEETH